MSKLDEKKMIDEIRLLSLDMINNAGCGDPGICISAAPIMYSLFANHLVYDMENVTFANRDRFVMSCGHGAPLLYATLYAMTEDYTIDDLKNYSHFGTEVPMYPELNVNKRIEATTGSMGQGMAMAVGMAIAEKYLEAKYNTKKINLFGYNIYTLCSDGDLMEGVSYEAAALAGKYKLNNLIVLYDANKMTSDGKLEKDYNEKIANMYVALGWDVFLVKNGDKVVEIDKAIESAKRSKLPSMVLVDTEFSKNSIYSDAILKDGKVDNDEITEIRNKIKGNAPFSLDEDNLMALRKMIKTRNQLLYSDWYKDYQNYVKTSDSKVVSSLDDYLNDEDIILNLDKVIDIEKLFLDKSMRDINFQIMNVISTFVDKFIGGSADLTNSTKAYLKNASNFDVTDYAGKNIAFGVRENAMGAILNGLALSNFRVFGSTHLVFADNMKTSIRSSAIMNLPVTYIFTHDSFVTTDGAVTLEPVEQIAMLRSIPNLEVYRPCDYKELIGSWQLILKNKKPSALIVAKNPTESYKFTSIMETSLGGYVISEVKNRLDVILIASGAEVTLAMQLKHELLKSFIEARVVSMPNINEFFKQSAEYQNQVLPKGYKRMVLELSNDMSLYRLVNNEDDIINIKKFGKNGTVSELLKEFELDIPSIIIKIKNNI